MEKLQTTTKETRQIMTKVRVIGLKHLAIWDIGIIIAVGIAKNSTIDGHRN